MRERASPEEPRRWCTWSAASGAGADIPRQEARHASHVGAWADGGTAPGLGRCGDGPECGSAGTGGLAGGVLGALYRAAHGRGAVDAAAGRLDAGGEPHGARGLRSPIRPWSSRISPTTFPSGSSIGAGAPTPSWPASRAPAEARCAEGISPTARRRVLEAARQAGGSPSAGAGSSPPGPHF